MQPEVYAEGLIDRPKYCDYKSWVHLIQGVTTLDPPRQSRYGDCWLLSAAYGLLSLFPKFMSDVLLFKTDKVQVNFHNATSFG